MTDDIGTLIDQHQHSPEIEGIWARALRQHRLQAAHYHQACQKALAALRSSSPTTAARVLTEALEGKP